VSISSSLKEEYERKIAVKDNFMGFNYVGE